MMQHRGDSAAALGMLHPSKPKEISDFGYVEQHQQQRMQQQQQPHQESHSHQSLCLAPAEIYEHIADGGQAKSRNSWLKEVVLGIMAGAFIGFGFATCMIAAGQVSAWDGGGGGSCCRLQAMLHGLQSLLCAVANSTTAMFCALASLLVMCPAALIQVSCSFEEPGLQLSDSTP
jgi:hypothetical protein